ncbi:MAG: bifunctional YncE family protein/alkaline phosphatase family protein [Sphingomonadales bacterium]|nr:bifunctional YncE family protein/alkaline phosphatase family protein [Sphingomonadales bacterium]MDE2569750.1 bifunctional YncE family protein/alkaline phosphatase family protein [Sphingomonadales bacterium]
MPTGQVLTPTAAPGASFEPLVTRIGPAPQTVADGAAAIAVSPDKRQMLVLTSGFNRYVGPDGKIMRDQSQQFVFRYAIGPRGARWVETVAVPNSYGGVAWRNDGRGFVVGGGVDDVLYLFARKGAHFVADGKIALGHKAGLGNEVKPQAAGVALSPDGHRAIVANYYNDSVSLIDLAARKVIAEQDLRPGKIDPAQSGVPGGEFPYAVAWVSPGRAYVSSPRDREIVALGINGDALSVTGRTRTIGEPTALMPGANGERLFATEDNADRLAVLDAKTGAMLTEPRLHMPESLGETNGGGETVAKGLNPNSLFQLPDGRLLVTLGGVNALAVVAPSAEGASVEGLVPTAWYPSAVATSADGRRVFVANRKSPPGPNPDGCRPKLAIYRSQPDACGPANQYIFQLEKAGLLQFPLPAETTLAQTSLQVAKNIGLESAGKREAAEAAIAGLKPHIRHIIFIIKENRTYDQVLGDLDRGNGDPKLAILGHGLSPNHHRLARQFVTLDNFYVSGEQSSTGWTWSTAARVPDMLEKTAPVNYAERGLGYESEEADRFIYTQQTMDERHAANPALSKDPDLLPGPRLVTAPDADDDALENQGFLWDAAIRAGLSVRNYGFSDASVYETGKPGDVPPVRHPFADKRRIYTPGDRLLAGRSDPYFAGFDQRLPDYWRELDWEREYGDMEAAGTLPALTLLRLSHDHFGSFNDAIDGVNTVETQMADNDYALGRVVERVAHGKAADSTLIFVIEDDAQNGSDHVDARRSPVFVVGPYVKHDALVSTRYTTVNVLRTIEAFLGLKPLGLNDAMAAPMADLFDPAQKDWTYTAVAAPVLKTTQLPIPPERYAANGAPACSRRSAAWWAEAMLGQDFTSEDRLDTRRFNAALWRGLGEGPEPDARSGADLRSDRAALTANALPGWTCGGLAGTAHR